MLEKSKTIKNRDLERNYLLWKLDNIKKQEKLKQQEKELL